MNKKRLFLGSVGGIILITGGGLFALNHFIDRQMIKTQLYQSIEKQTGRKVTLDRLSICFFPWPEIQASKITLSNKPEGHAANLITADQLKASINLWGLWNKEIDFNALHLTNVKVFLERDQKGYVNWKFKPLVTNQDNNKDNTPNNRSRWSVKLSNIQLKNITISFVDDYKHKNLYVNLKDADLNQFEQNKIRFDINGFHHQTDFNISGRINNFDQLFSINNTNSLPPIKLQVSLSEYIHNQKVGNIHISGNIKDIMNLKGYDFTFRGTILNLKDLNQLFPHAHLPSIQDITLNTVIKDTALDTDPIAKPEVKLLQFHTRDININSLPSLHMTSMQIIANQLDEKINVQLTGKYNDQMFRWSGELGRLDNLQNIILNNPKDSIPINGNLSSSQYNAKLHGTIGGEHPSLNTELNLLSYQHDFENLGILSAQDIFYKGKIALPFAFSKEALENIQKTLLENISIEGAISSNFIQLDQYQFKKGTANVIWKDKRLNLNNISLLNKNIAIKGSVEYSTKHDEPSMIAKINHTIVPMKWVDQWFRLPTLYSNNVELVGTLYSHGNTKEQFLSNITGHLGIAGVGGDIDIAGIKHFIGKVSQTFSLKGNSLPVQCLAIHTTIYKDKMFFDTLTLQAQPFALNGNGTISFPNQQLDLHLTPDIYVGVVNASSPIRIGGTLSKPTAGFDTNKNKVFVLNINPMKKSAVPKNYCVQALSKAREE